MAGYNGYSKSNNAIDAESRGLMTATSMSKYLNKKGILKGIKSKDISSVCDLSEWHHTGKYYQQTNYYSIFEVFEKRSSLRAVIKQSASDKRETTVNFETIQVVEFTRSRGSFVPEFIKYNNVSIKFTKQYSDLELRFFTKDDFCTIFFCDGSKCRKKIKNIKFFSEDFEK